MHHANTEDKQGPFVTALKVAGTGAAFQWEL